jgi:Fuc2NAc and GlcNAc transferase
MPALLLFLGSTALTWLIVGALVRHAPRIGLVDRPNERSLHVRVTPRGGGLGFVATVTVGFGVAPLLGWSPPGAAWVCLGAALIVAAVSLRDDFRSVGAGVRFLLHVGAAVAAVVAAGGFREVAVPGLGVWPLGLVGLAVTVVWIVGLTNVYNFMDGIDGLAGVQGLVAGLAWAFAGWLLEVPVVTGLGLALAGGCAGFLGHNWSPAKIFMGDVGSAFLGYLFGVIPLLALGAADPERGGRLPVFAALAVGPFLADGIYTFLRRAWRREPVWKPHRSHLYQRLVQAGWSHARVTGLYAGWCVVSAVAGMAWLGRVGTVTEFVAVGVAVAGLPAVWALVRRGVGRAARCRESGDGSRESGVRQTPDP